MLRDVTGYHVPRHVTNFPATDFSLTPGHEYDSCSSSTRTCRFVFDSSAHANLLLQHLFDGKRYFSNCYLKPIVTGRIG